MRISPSIAGPSLVTWTSTAVQAPGRTLPSSSAWASMWTSGLGWTDGDGEAAMATPAVARGASKPSANVKAAMRLTRLERRFIWPQVRRSRACLPETRRVAASKTRGRDGKLHAPASRSARRGGHPAYLPQVPQSLQGPDARCLQCRVAREPTQLDFRSSDQRPRLEPPKQVQGLAEIVRGARLDAAGTQEVGHQEPLVACSHLADEIVERLCGDRLAP